MYQWVGGWGGVVWGGVVWGGDGGLGPGAERNGEQRSARELGGGGKSVEAGGRNGVEGGG